jgi:hypothetical protein
VSGVSRQPGMGRWLVISAALHLCLLALPVAILEVVFPTGPAPVPRAGKDLTPDFRDIALHLVEPPADAGQAARTGKAGEIQPVDEGPTLPEPELRVAGGEAGLPAPVGTATEPGAGGGRPGIESGFFPPVPRLVVPPDLSDLNVARLSVLVRVLVGTDGRPAEIEIPDTLSNSLVRERILESIAGWRFEPAHEGGIPVRAWTDMPLELETSR